MARKAAAGNKEIEENAVNAVNNDNAVNEENGANESLEKMLERIDGIIEKLEDDDIPLEEAFSKYSEGVKLVAECNKSVDRVEKKVRLLMDNGDTEDFE